MAAKVETDAKRAAHRRAATTQRPTLRRRRRSGSDQVTVALLSIAACLAVLAALASQRPAAAQTHPVRVFRKIYETTVVETIPDAGGRNTTSVTKAVSSSGGAAPIPVATRAS
jgi:hypothetical protein